jgi:hypothetical protein
MQDAEDAKNAVRSDEPSTPSYLFSISMSEWPRGCGKYHADWENREWYGGDEVQDYIWKKAEVGWRGWGDFVTSWLKNWDEHFPIWGAELCNSFKCSCKSKQRLLIVLSLLISASTRERNVIEDGRLERHLLNWPWELLRAPQEVQSPSEPGISVCQMSWVKLSWFELRYRLRLSQRPLGLITRDLSYLESRVTCAHLYIK